MSGEAEAASRAASKRFEGLVTVRTKAIKGKGAWYWAHLEPVLLPHPETGLPKSVKLKCSLCHSLFSASNPSRTASEHLKRGTCSNFSSPSPSPPSASAPPLTPSPPHDRLKSPKTSPRPALSKDQVHSAFDLLFDWFYQSFGSLSLSALHHPKFHAFLTHLGLPNHIPKELSGPRLDSRLAQAQADSDAKIRDALFFQLSTHGWNTHSPPLCCSHPDRLVKFLVNLPNGTTVFQKALFTSAVDNSNYAQELLSDTLSAVAGSAGLHRCVGIVADKFKAKALRSLEIQHHWMVNTCCQVQGLSALIKDFTRDLPLFASVVEACSKLARFINGDCRVRTVFLRCREMDCAGLIRVPSPKCDPLKNFHLALPMLEDVLASARVIQMVVMEDVFKVACMEDPTAREVAGMVQSEAFWNELDAVFSLVKLVKGMVDDVEAERPMIGRCLPLWEELKGKVKEWCGKYNIAEGPVEKIVDKRFRKNYHPAWSAAFILDPLYLIKDASGKYLPPFKCLTREQEKDVDKLLTRLATREEAHVVLMELMKWRSEGLDPLYAQAVQMKQRDPVTGKMKVANPLSSRLVWETCLSEFKSLGKIAVRLIFLHATSCGFKSSNWSFMRKISANKQSRVAVERAQKMIYIAAHAKLERRDFSSEEEKDAELFALSGSEEDGMLAEVYADAPLV
ncbi:hypothetical protein Fmac_015706 [Flemingia macrophylla]|uniref:DUF7963 domain-containing protein n=1 Tax=Flemingia macrophylla TaxID=520843 RepID=A0ABD1MFB8_9FABA